MLNSMPEEIREACAYMLRAGNVCAFYYHEPAANPTEDDFIGWVQGLPLNFAAEMLVKGYQACKGLLPLRRHAAERKDLGLDQYMKDALSEKDYVRWAVQKQPGPVFP